MRSVEIYLAGKRYLLNTDEDKEYLLELASYVNRMVESFQGPANTTRASSKLSLEQAACFASLKIADELFKLREKHEELKYDVKGRAEKVMHSLEKLKNHPA